MKCNTITDPQAGDKAGLLTHNLSIHYNSLILTNADVRLKAYTLKEFSILYEVDERTFKRWVKPFEKELGPLEGRYFLIPQVKIIFAHLGIPSTLSD